jgi:hypothetical protein
MVPVLDPGQKTWIGKADPGYKGETIRTVPFDWEGK